MSNPQLSDYVPTVLHLAAKGRCSMLTRFFLHPELKFNPNAQNKYGDTPLHFAAGSGDPDTVNALIQGGAKADAVDNFGNNPLFPAAFSKNIGVINTLLKAGACPWARNKNGDNPSNYAYNNDLVPIARHLLKATIQYPPQRRSL